MPTLICLLASPRRSGNSDLLAQAACAAFAEAGGEVQQIVLGDLSLHDCRGCDWCKTPHPASPDPCAQKDDMQALYRQMSSAGAILWATPIYYWSPTVALKMVIDRLFCWGEWQETRHRKALARRPVGAVFSFADEEVMTSGYYHAYSICKAACESSGGRWAGAAYGAATDAGEIAHDAEALARARALGEKLWRMAGER